MTDNDLVLVAMSDCCRGHAMSAVLDGDGWYWRCRHHLGLVKGNQEGDVRFAMEVDE